MNCLNVLLKASQRPGDGHTGLLPTEDIVSVSRSGYIISPLRCLRHRLKEI